MRSQRENEQTQGLAVAPFFGFTFLRACQTEIDAATARQARLPCSEGNASLSLLISRDGREHRKIHLSCSTYCSSEKIEAIIRKMEHTSVGNKNLRTVICKRVASN